MAGFFKKVAGAFVEIEDDESGAAGADPEQLSDEAAALLAELEAGATSQAVPRATAPAVAAGTAQQPMTFEDIYSRAGVPNSPYTAETLLRVIDGLRAMSPAQALQTVKAFDDADPRWTVADVLLDADKKVEALRSVQGDLANQVAHADQAYTTAKAAREQKQAKLESDIAAEIAKLNDILKQGQTEVATEEAAATSQLEATRQSATQETQRLDAEILRLSEVRSFLADPNTLGSR